MFNKFPYTDFHEMNLDYIINKVQELITEVKNFKITGEIHYHDPIEWNPTTYYTKNTIVLNTEDKNTYISKQDVPAGIDISNPDYWYVISYGSAELLNYMKSYDTIDKMKFSAVNVNDIVFCGGRTDLNDGSTYFFRIKEERPTTPYIQLASGLYAEYLNSNAPIYVDTVEDMISSNLDLGTVILTKGYHAISDGGSATYVVVENSTDLSIELDNGYFAELYIDKTMNPMQFGAYGDGVHDDTDAIQLMLNNCRDIEFNDGTYLVRTITGNISHCLHINSFTYIRLSDNAIIRAIPNESQAYSIFYMENVNNIHISGGVFRGDRTLNVGEWGMGINIIESTDVILENINVYDCLGDGIYIGGNDTTYTHSSNITVRNCESHHNRRQGITITSVDGCVIDNCYIHHIEGTNPQAGIDIEKNTNQSINKNITIKNCMINNNHFSDILIENYTENVIITDCILGGNIVIKAGSNIKINNITTHANTIYGINIFNADIVFNNCKFSNISLTPSATTNYKFNSCNFNYTHVGQDFIDIRANAKVVFNSCSFSALQSGSSNTYGIAARNGSVTRFIGCDIELNYQFESKSFYCDNYSEIINCFVKLGNTSNNSPIDFNSCNKIINSTFIIPTTVTGSAVRVGNSRSGDNVIINGNTWYIPNYNYCFSIDSDIDKISITNNIVEYQHEEGDTQHFIYNRDLPHLLIDKNNIIL